MIEALDRYLASIPTEEVVDDRFFQYSKKAFDICRYLTDDVMAEEFAVSFRSMGTPSCESRLVDLGDEFVILHDIELDGMLRELLEALNGGVVRKNLIFRLQKFVVNKLAARGFKGYAVPFALNKIWATDLDPSHEDKDIFVEMKPEEDDLSQKLQTPRANLYPQDLFVVGHEFGHILATLGRFSIEEEKKRIESTISAPPKGLQFSSRMFLSKLDAAINGDEKFRENREFFCKLANFTSDKGFLEEAFCDRVAWEITSSVDASILELNSDEEVGLSVVSLMRGILLLNSLLGRIERLTNDDKHSGSHSDLSAQAFFRMKLIDVAVEEELHDRRMASAQSETERITAALSFSIGGHELVRKRATVIESIVFDEVFAGLGRLEENSEEIGKYFTNPYVCALWYMLYDLPEHDSIEAMRDVGQFHSDEGREVLKGLKSKYKVSLCSPKKKHQDAADKIMNEMIF